MAGPLVEFRAVGLGYGVRALFRDLDLRIEPRDFLAFVGPNGAGKTTLLRAIAGILAPAAGQVLRSPSAVIGYVPQERDLDPVFPLSASDVVLQGRVARMGPGRRPRPADQEAVERALAQADVSALARSAFRDLSAGQKQRVLVARALAAEPTLLVLDEPTSGTDIAAERGVMDLLRQLHAASELAIVLATHNLAIAANYARRIAVVDHTRGLFRLGTDSEILTDETLTGLYGRDVRVRRLDGWRTIVAGAQP